MMKAMPRFGPANDKTRRTRTRMGLWRPRRVAVRGGAGLTPVTGRAACKREDFANIRFSESPLAEIGDSLQLRFIVMSCQEGF
jgi:hypothetical protein